MNHKINNNEIGTNLETASDSVSTTEKNGEKGASLVEYALLLALIAVVCIVAVRVIGGRASLQFSSISRQL